MQLAILFAADIEIVGTPLYIPPEVGKQQRIEVARNDIWSLGVIAWELVCDTNPWGLDVDRTSPVKIIEVTNATIKPNKKPACMSYTYYNFICSLVCPLDHRSTVEEAMKHRLFDGIDFTALDELFPKDEPHADLQDNLALLNRHGLQGSPPTQRRTLTRVAPTPPLTPPVIMPATTGGNNPRVYLNKSRILPASTSILTPPVSMSSSLSSNNLSSPPTSKTERKTDQDMRLMRGLIHFEAWQAKQKSANVESEKAARTERRSADDDIKPKRKKSIFASFTLPNW